MTKKQKLFVEEYLIDLNATQAAIRAGYSSDTAKVIGSENLTKPDIRTRIDKAMAERSRRTGVNSDRVVQELAKIAFVNAVDVIDPKTATVKEGALPEDTAAILSVKVKTFGEDGLEREIKMADKIKALELLGKHMGMFKEKVDLTVQTSQKLDDIMSQMGGEGLEE
ncbi:terminase small subunit [Lacrimispora sp.]|uniref:terminase small subunit n=1 Tax=Lacrimispora sp. TaxID=2719234 RepID=UPI0039E413E7